MENGSEHSPHTNAEQVILELAKRKWPDLFFQALFNSVAFLLALGITSYLSNMSEVGTYKAMMKAIGSEAAANKTIADQFKITLKQQDLLVIDFSLTTVTRTLASPLFVKHADPDDIKQLDDYLRRLSKANSYRGMLTSVELSTNPLHRESPNAEQKQFLDLLTNSFQGELGRCKDSIMDVTLLSDKATR
jgi:hypothetical protein